MGNFTDLAHAAFSVKDIDRTLAFYEQLGIREAFRLHHDDGTLMLVYLHVAGDRFMRYFPVVPALTLNVKRVLCTSAC